MPARPEPARDRRTGTARRAVCLTGAGSSAGQVPAPAYRRDYPAGQLRMAGGQQPGPGPRDLLGADRVAVTLGGVPPGAFAIRPMTRSLASSYTGLPLKPGCTRNAQLRSESSCTRLPPGPGRGPRSGRRHPPGGAAFPGSRTRGHGFRPAARQRQAAREQLQAESLPGSLRPSPGRHRPGTIRARPRATLGEPCGTRGWSVINAMAVRGAGAANCGTTRMACPGQAGPVRARLGDRDPCGWPGTHYLPVVVPGPSWQAQCPGRARITRPGTAPSAA